MSLVDAWERFAALGEKMGLAGNELRKWVVEQVKAAEDKQKADQDREMRSLEREAKHAEIAAKAKEELEVREALRKEAELDKMQALEREKKEHKEIELKLREVELEKAKLENAEGSEAGDDSDGASSQGSHTSAARHRGRKGPKLPHFDEAKDNIDSYLRRFERYADLQKWPKEEWALYLSALLKGKALEVYSRLTEEEAKSYERLKAALLRKYELTVEGFRKRFYEARRDHDETAAQFVCRIVGYLDRWVQLAGIEETFEGLKGLIVKEQFLTVSEAPLTLYLRERSPKDLNELVNLADLYLEARINPGRGNRDKISSDSKFKKVQPGNMVASDGGRQREKFITNRESRLADSKEGRVCYYCGKPDHIKRFCPQLKAEKRSGSQVDTASSCQVVSDSHKGSCTHLANDCGCLKLECGCELPFVGCLTVRPGEIKPGTNGLPVKPGRANGVEVSVLRDTGCTAVIIRRSLVHEDQLTGMHRYYRMLDGTVGKAQIAMVDIESPYASGKFPCLCIDTPTCDVIIGNIPEVLEADEPHVVNAVTTRAQALAKDKPPKPMVVLELKELHIAVTDMQQLQHSSSDLKKWFDLAKTGQVVRTGKRASVKFLERHGLLYRVYATEQGHETEQLAVPTDLRKGVLSLAHESIMSGHLGTKKTLDRILSQFAWPGIAGDVARHCRSCDACQRTVHKGRVAKAPLQKMPVIGIPFQRVGIDLVGPITPASTSGCRFILTVVDYATRYPEAVALRGISTQEVAEALCKIYSRVGVPSQIISDQGTQFMSDVMKEVSRLLSIEHVTSTPYHPQCNGLVERFNGTLKSMLKKLCAEKPSNWDRYLEAVLFAYREVKQESVGFSPFELLYGRTVRGPMAILRELWSKDVPEEEVQSTYQYVFELRNRLEDTCKLVEESLKESQVKAKAHFDRKSRIRELKAGNKVLILLPTDSHKLLMQWKGPFEVTERVGLADYRVQLPSGSKVFHINMLKQYFEREDAHGDSLQESVLESSEVVATAVLEEGDGDPLEVQLPSRTGDARETISDVHICPELSEVERAEIHQLLGEFSDIFSDLPGLTQVVEHKILLTDHNPIRCKPYPIPFALRETVKSEVEEMCRLGVIERSDSPYSSPLLLVKKKDGTNRPVVDFRKVNKVTIFDAEPMPRVDDIYARLANAKYFSTLDFCKGYWQIPMAKEDREKTAFSTPFGLFHFVRMPFGLQNAGATYSRMMRYVLDGLESTDNFVDDVVSFTDEWNRHLEELRALFERVRAAGLTVKPSKCHFGYKQVEYVGHVVGGGNLRTMSAKTDKIAHSPVPRTKRQLRSFLGLSGYYRRFVPDYATIAAPLTDLTRGKSPNQIPWDAAQDQAFTRLKNCLCSEPVLRLPDPERPFVLRTDASDVGLGAVLLQEYPDGTFPVAYLSRRLSRAEMNYSVVERECLAVVWAVGKFYSYLYGRAFVLQTDHRPLTYLDNAKMTNARVMRWALSLQPFRYRVESIKGSENVGADYLSRVPV